MALELTSLGVPVLHQQGGSASVVLKGTRIPA